MDEWPGASVKRATSAVGTSIGKSRPADTGCQQPPLLQGVIDQQRWDRVYGLFEYGAGKSGNFLATGLTLTIWIARGARLLFVRVAVFSAGMALCRVK